MIVAELLARLGIVTDDASVRKANAAISGVQQGLQGLQAVTAGFIGALGLGGLVAGFGKAVKATADYGDQTKLLAQRTGVSADAIQKLAYAASLSNVGSEELAVGLQHLAKTGVKDTYAETLRLAEQFSKMPDSAEKTALAMQKFGRAGARLIPVLNAGKDGLAELAAEAQALGLVIDQETLDAADAFNDELDRLKGLAQGVRNRLTVGFLKPLKEIAILFRQNVLGFIDAHPALMKFLTDVDAVNYVLTTLATLMTVVAAVGLVMAAPFIALVAAVLLAGAVVQDFLYYLTGDGESLVGDFVKYYQQEFNSLGEFTKAIFDWAGDVVQNFLKTYGKKIAEFFDPISRFTAPLVKMITGADPAEKTKFYNAQGLEIDGNTGERKNFVATQPAMVTTYTPTGPDNYPWLMSAPQIEINVNAAPGMDTGDLAKKTKEQFWGEWSTMMQETHASIDK